MKSQKITGMGLNVAVLVAAGGLLLGGCITNKTGLAGGDAGYQVNRPPVEASAAVKAEDFRLSPPAVEDVSIEKLPGGKALVMVKFGEDKRLGAQVTILPEESPVVLRDDGKGGDKVAGDRIYSAVVTLDVDALATEEDQTLALMKKTGEPMVAAKFQGREITGEEKIDSGGLSQFREHRILKLPPFGTGARSRVDASRSLFITDTNVIRDPGRTFEPCSGTGTMMGKWTFGYLMTQMANEPVTGVDPSDFVMNWLQTWLSNQTVNGFTVAARNGMQHSVIDQWPKLPNGKLDLGRAPFRLSAIVNRIDLAGNFAYGKAGGAEGRLVFTLFNGGTNPVPVGCSGQLFTVIFEYGVPIHTCAGIRGWAQQWLNLKNFTLGSPAYNAALEAITEQFAAANADPSKPNGSALDQLRTDEFALEDPWELREFHVVAGHQLQEVTVTQTPDRATYFAGEPQNADLATWINQNALAIVQDRHLVPLNLPFAPGNHFRGGSSLNQIDAWNAPGIVNESTRHHFSLNTCNACHGAETGNDFPSPTPFRHVLDIGQGTVLSRFLTGQGMPVTVPVPGNPQYNYNDLLRRAQILQADATSSCLMLVRVPVTLATH